MTAIKSKRPLSLGQAKTKFIATVQTGIEELMFQCGHSRARATRALLKEIGRDCDPPSDTEVRKCFVKTIFIKTCSCLPIC
jgi:hypothetical protein